MIFMNIYEQIGLKIIREQELLMGPVAWYEAGKVQNLRIIDREKGIIAIEEGADGSLVINNLVDRFGSLFGRAGREVCKEAVGALVADLQPSQIPASLK
jgi:hypothetical protein